MINKNWFLHMFNSKNVVNANNLVIIQEAVSYLGIKDKLNQK